MDYNNEENVLLQISSIESLLSYAVLIQLFIILSNSSGVISNFSKVSLVMVLLLMLFIYVENSSSVALFLYDVRSSSAGRFFWETDACVIDGCAIGSDTIEGDIDGCAIGSGAIISGLCFLLSKVTGFKHFLNHKLYASQNARLKKAHIRVS